MARRILMVGVVLALLGGCGKAAVRQVTGNGAAPARKAVAASSRKVDCRTLPDFVPIFADARVDGCVSGSGEAGSESGTITYTTAAAPRAVLLWYKNKSAAEGLAEAMSSPTLYGAREPGKRNLIVLTDVMKNGTKVTINWGRSR